MGRTITALGLLLLGVAWIGCTTKTIIVGPPSGGTPTSGGTSGTSGTSGTPSTSGTEGTVAPPLSCEFTSHTSCTCESGGSSNHVECDPTSLSGAVCCASAGYASGSGTCTCTSDTTTCTSGTPVDECSTGATSTPPSGTSTPPSGGSCSDKGFCGPTSSECNCGTICIHAAVGDYLCGIGCGSDAECQSKRDPASGAAFTYCTQANDGFSRFCN